MESLPPAVLPYLPLVKGILSASAILICGWIAAGWVHRLALRALSLRRIDQALGRFFAAIARYLVLCATVITALESVGLHTTSLVAILASAGLAVGLALQGSLANFASGVLILFFRPFQLSDKIGVGDKVGVVEDIGLFTTTLVTADNEKIIVPNTIVTGGPIVNYSDRGNRRGALTVTVEMEIADLPRSIEAFLTAARRTEGVAPQPPAEVEVADMERGSVDLSVQVWYRAIDESQVMHRLRRAVMEELAATGLKLGQKHKVVVQGKV